MFKFHKSVRYPLTAALSLALCIGAPAQAGGAEGPVAAQLQSQQGFVEVNGARINYTVVGQGEPMLLLHGYPLSGDLFARNREALARAGYKVITLDHRGYGQSLAPTVPASIETYAQDALAVMDRLQVPKAIIGGMSMGGPIAFEMYRRAPDRFRGMILIDTIAAPASIAEAGLWRGVAEQAAVKGVDSLVPFLIKDMLSGDTRVFQPEVAEFLGAIVRRASVQAAVGGAYALANRPDSTQLLGQIRVPVLILVGREDTIYPVAIARQMNQMIQGSKLTIIPDASHAAVYEKANEANKAIIDWARTIR